MAELDLPKAKKRLDALVAAFAKDRETSFDGADALIFPKSKTGEDTIYAKSISLQ
eukprot:gene27102-33159_t